MRPDRVDAPITAGLLEVLAERERQKLVEGWSPGHDDAHTDRSLARAAAAYAWVGSQTDEYVEHWNETGWRHVSALMDFLWPRSWNIGWWKPKEGDDGRRRNLVRAAALLLAELERLDREQAREEAPPTEPSAAFLDHIDDVRRYKDV